MFVAKFANLLTVIIITNVHFEPQCLVLELLFSLVGNSV